MYVAPVSVIVKLPLVDVLFGTMEWIMDSGIIKIGDESDDVDGDVLGERKVETNMLWIKSNVDVLQII